MNYNLTLKGHFENLTWGQDHDLSEKGHVAYQSIRVAILNSEHSQGVFIALSGLYQKLLLKTAGDLSCPEMTLGSWGGVTVAIFYSGCEFYL